MTDPKTRALELVDELEHEAMGSDSYDSGTAIALRSAITQIPTTHTWVPIAECGELADGEYVVRVDVLTVCVSEFVVTATRADGKFSIEIPDTLAHEITHVLSPHLGPIPEAP